MIELSSSRKNKINLLDYPYQKDIANRLLMSTFSTLEVDVIQEILYNPLKIPIAKLSRSLELSFDKLLPILQKLTRTSLFTIQGELLYIDKEMRKYFESEMHKFNVDFNPDMEALQVLLKKVPIHILPTWYSIPRTSNNIFESIVEKYLLTPQIYQRHLLEIQAEDPIFSQMIQDIFHAPNFILFAEDLCRKYSLSHEEFEEYILYLEFHFIAALNYILVGDEWKEAVTPFREWKEYLIFQKKTEITPIKKNKVKRKWTSDFFFVEKITLALLGKAPTNDPDWQEVQKKCQLIKIPPDQWFSLSSQEQALYLYRRLTDKSIREVEKRLKEVAHLGWIFLEDFIQGTTIFLHEDNKVLLKRYGKSWKYTLPCYTEGEKTLIKTILFEYLFETAMIAIGEVDGKACFSVTPFGRTFFE